VTDDPAAPSPARRIAITTLLVTVGIFAPLVVGALAWRAHAGQTVGWADDGALSFQWADGVCARDGHGRWAAVNEDTWTVAAGVDGTDFSGGPREVCVTGPFRAVHEPWRPRTVFFFSQRGVESRPLAVDEAAVRSIAADLRHGDPTHLDVDAVLRRAGFAP
jgi:hypothetical protein